MTGFSGIVVALSDRRGESLSRVKGMSFRILVAGSLAAMLFSLIPFLLHYLGVSPALMWSICSGVVALYMIPIIVIDVRTFRRHTEELSIFERRAGHIIVVVGLGLWASQVANAVVVHGFGLYLVAPMWFLAFSALSFARLLLDLQTRRT